MNFFRVGGCVRDRLLGIDSKDVDWVVVGATPEEMLAKGFEQVGADFPVFLHPETGEEYALARKERRTGKGYHGFATEFGKDVTLKDDMFRRDLTINALALDGNGDVIDLTGQGLGDMKNKVFRHINLDDDPVRVLRLARFLCRSWAQDWTVADETYALCFDMQEQMKNLTAERVWAEMRKALEEPHSEKFFEFLESVHLLHIVFPEISALTTATENLKWHPEGDSFAHTMLVLKQAELRRECVQDPVLLKLAALTHDMGKGVTPFEKMPSHFGHDKAGAPIVENFCRRLRMPKRYIKLLPLICEKHMKMHCLHEMKPNKLTKLLLTFGAQHRDRDDLRYFIQLGACDRRGRLHNENAVVTDLMLLQSVSYNLQTDFQTAVNEYGVDPTKEGPKMAEEMWRARIRMVTKAPYYPAFKKCAKYVAERDFE